MKRLHFTEMNDSNTNARYDELSFDASAEESREEVLRTLHTLMSRNKLFMPFEVSAYQALGANRPLIDRLLDEASCFAPSAFNELLGEFGLDLRTARKSDFIQCFIDELKKSPAPAASNERARVVKEYLSSLDSELTLIQEPKSYVDWLTNRVTIYASTEADRYEKLLDLHKRLEQALPAVKRAIYEFAESAESARMSDVMFLVEDLTKHQAKKNAVRS